MILYDVNQSQTRVEDSCQSNTPVVFHHISPVQE